MSKRKRNFAQAGHFYVENLAGFCAQTKERCQAVLVFGVRGFAEELEPSMTCHLMTNGEIDYEVNEMIEQLETLRRKAKTMLIKHRSDQDKLAQKKTAPRP